MTTATVILAVRGPARHHSAGFTWSEGATMIAAVIAAVIVVVGYSIQRNAARRDEHATLCGSAVATVEDYLEGPYRIRRKDGSPETRFAISSGLSDVKAAISKHTALLEMHAPENVATAYGEFVAVAIAEAGPQMTAAWGAGATDSDAKVPLGVGDDRTDPTPSARR